MACILMTLSRSVGISPVTIYLYNNGIEMYYEDQAEHVWGVHWNLLSPVYTMR